jgi:urease accessory protein
MDRDARRMRGDGPLVFAQVTRGVGVEDIAAQILRALPLMQVEVPDSSPAAE